MSFDFSSLFWIFIVIMVLQPLLTARWYVVRRAQAIRAIEKLHGTRVITMIHRQEKRSLFGFSVSRHIDLEDAQTIIAAIKDTPEDMPIDFVIHTPGGLVLAAMQIARALEAHKAKVTAYVPVYAMSGGTLLALAANEIVLGEFSVLGPIDPQIVGLPAASIVKARDLKPVESVFDLTLVLADVAEKALVQVKQGAVELLTPRMERSAAEALAAKLAGGHWTHDYALTASEARALGLPVKIGMPPEIMTFMTSLSAANSAIRGRVSAYRHAASAAGLMVDVTIPPKSGHRLSARAVSFAGNRARLQTLRWTTSRLFRR